VNIRHGIERQQVVSGVCGGFYWRWLVNALQCVLDALCAVFNANFANLRHTELDAGVLCLEPASAHAGRVLYADFIKCVGHAWVKFNLCLCFIVLAMYA
jgi:hypothetical protein